jgi:hypothetical protein
VFSAASKGNSDINYDVVLRNTNGKLTEWDEKWRSEMTKAKGEGFHLSFLSFFRLYVRLFLNSFGIQATLLPVSIVKFWRKPILISRFRAAVLHPVSKLSQPAGRVPWILFRSFRMILSK